MVLWVCLGRTTIIPDADRHNIGKEHPLESKNIRNAGLKVTLPRIKILEILERPNHAQHLSAESIFKTLVSEGEEIGLATVYRVLTQFEAAGLVIRHHFEGGNSVFELNRGDHHDHLVCIHCGKVEEFHDETIEQLQSKIAQQRNFQLTDHSLCLYGICKDCQTSKPRA
jgi:Fur family ferric uptake transcriptional regulator